MSRLSLTNSALLLTVLALGTGGVWAQSPPANAPQAQSRGYRADLPESVRRVERETGGEVLRAEPMQRDGREIYRLKVLTADGRVRVVQDDPNDRRDQDQDRLDAARQDRQDRDRSANRKEKR